MTKRVNVPTNRGQQLLISTGLSLSKIANGLQCSAPTVSGWRNGETLPQKRYRAKLEAVYAIPRASWDQPPDNVAPPVDEEPGEAPPAMTPAQATDAPIQPAQSNLPPYPPPPKNASTLDNALHSLACLRHDLKHRPMTAAARSKVRADEIRAINLIAKLEEREELSESKYVDKHPRWIELRTRILAALEPYPEAAQAVIDALSEDETEAA